MAYKLNFSKQASKALEKIHEPFYSSIKRVINDLAENPRPHGYKKLIDRKGYRIRVADYRIIYDIIDRELIIDIITIGNRRDIYQ